MVNFNIIMYVDMGMDNCIIVNNVIFINDYIMINISSIWDDCRRMYLCSVFNVLFSVFGFKSMG